MFFRINSFIKYDYLSNETKIKLIERYYENLYKQLDGDEKCLIDNSNIKQKYIEISSKFDNARQIKNFIRNDIARELLNNIN